MRYLVAWDGSTGALAALREARRFAGPAADVVVLQVVNPLIDAAHIVAPSRDEALAILEKQAQSEFAAACAAGGWPTTELHIVRLDRDQDVATRILEEAGVRGADIVVMSSHRAAGVRGLLLGSVTQAVLGQADLPVLVVRP